MLFKLDVKVCGIEVLLCKATERNCEIVAKKKPITTNWLRHNRTNLKVSVARDHFRIILDLKKTFRNLQSPDGKTGVS